MKPNRGKKSVCVCVCKLAKLVKDWVCTIGAAWPSCFKRFWAPPSSFSTQTLAHAVGLGQPHLTHMNALILGALWKARVKAPARDVGSSLPSLRKRSEETDKAVMAFPGLALNTHSSQGLLLCCLAVYQHQNSVLARFMGTRSSGT